MISIWIHFDARSSLCDPYENNFPCVELNKVSDNHKVIYVAFVASIFCCKTSIQNSFVQCTKRRTIFYRNYKEESPNDKYNGKRAWAAWQSLPSPSWGVGLAHISYLMFINLFFQFADREAVHVLVPLEVSLGFPDPLEKFFPKFYKSLPFLHQVIDLSSPYCRVVHYILPMSLQLADLYENERMW